MRIHSSPAVFLKRLPVAASDFPQSARWHERKARSLLTLVMMCAANRPHELRIHLRGAIKNACTREEIREVLLQVAIYYGIPASLDAHNMALEVFAEAK